MRNKSYLILLTLILQIGGGKCLKASPVDLPDLSTPEAPKYYVIMNASKSLDSDNNNEYRYLRYQGWNRNRPKLERVGVNMDDASLWYFVSANGSKSVSEGCYIASVGAEKETHAYSSNTFEGPYLSNARQYNSNLAFFSQQTSNAVWYIQRNPYDAVGCAISTGANLTGNSWYYDNIALIGEDNVFVKTGTLKNQDYYKYVFLSYEDLLEIAEANDVADMATYRSADQTKGASFKALIQAIDAAKASATGPASYATGADKYYYVKNRRFGYYLNTDGDGTTLQSVTAPTVHSLWSLQNVGGTYLLVSQGRNGSSVRVNISDNTATWNLTAPNAYNAALIKASDGDKRYVAFQPATATNGYFSMNTTVNDHAIYARSSQGFASDWELIPVENLSDADNAVFEDEISEDKFYRLRNVTRSIATYNEDVFDGGGWLEDVDKTHFQYRKTETTANSFDADEAELIFNAKDADFYVATPDKSHANALWQFELIGHGASGGENATGLISPEHNIYYLRNVNTGKYIGTSSTTAGGVDFPQTADRNGAAAFYLERLIDGQYALNLYSGTGSNGLDVNSGCIVATGTSEGRHAALCKADAAGKAKNTAYAWIITPAEQLEVNLINGTTNDGLDWSTFYFPFDVKKSAANEAGQDVNLFQAKWLIDQRELEMTEVVDVPANQGVIVRSSSTRKFVFDIFPAGSGETATTADNYSENIWQGIYQAEEIPYFTGTEWKNYWVLSHNSNNDLRLLHPAGNYLLGNRAYLTAESLSGIKPLDIRFIEGSAMVTGISSPATSSPASEAIYDLQGRRVTAPRNGLYIRGGKKVFIK